MPPSTYYVVGFLDLPRPDVDKYVCVPDTWIKGLGQPNSTVSVAYPEGHPAQIEHLARMNQSDPNYWPAYNASVKYCTSSYEQAINYLKFLREFGSSRTGSNVPTNQRRSSEGPSGHRPTATTSNSGGVGVNNKAYKRPLLVNVSTRAPMHQTRPQQMPQSSAGTANHASASGTRYPVHENHPNRSSRASLKSRPMGVPQHNNPSTSMRDVQATQNVSHGCQRPGTSSDHGCCATKFDAVLGNVQANVQKLVTEFNHWATVNARNNEKLMEVSTWVKDYQVLKRSVDYQLSERPRVSEIPRTIKAGIIPIEDDDDNGVYHGNSRIPDQLITTQEPRTAHQRRMAQFTLPPEYDRNDSRWTLRYRYPRPSLRELIPYSRIYVDSKKLAHCLVSAKDCKSLARLLVLEVFSDNALKVCSFTGKRCFFYNRNSPVRPGLDENARNMLVKYIEKCGRQKGWPIPDGKAIANTMRGKLEDYRRKAQNNN